MKKRSIPESSLSSGVELLEDLAAWDDGGDRGDGGGVVRGLHGSGKAVKVGEDHDADDG